ncbi:MAG: chemotaxis protein CheA [Verrucomicrobiota bacterium]
MGSDDISSKLQKYLDKLSMEVVLAESGTDRGQLPVRDLLSNITENTENIPSLAQFHRCALFALSQIEAILDALRPFTSADIQLFNDLLGQLKNLYQNPSATFTPSSSVEAPSKKITTNAEVASSTVEEEDEPCISVSDIADADLLGDFMTEAVEHLENIEQGILLLEENPLSAETLNSVFRSFHTLKGGAGFLHLVPIQSLAHELESLLDLARQGKLAVHSGIINLILEGRDVVNRYILEIQQQIKGQKPPAPIAIPTRHLIGRVKNAIMGKSTPSEPTSPARVESSPVVSSPLPVKTAPAKTSFSAPSFSSKPSQPVKTEEEKMERVAATVVKVDTQKLDSLFDMVGEMVIAQSMIAQAPELVSIKSEKLMRNLSLLSRITNELQKTAMSIRMVPIRSTFQKMNRVVRDLSVKSGKQVNLRLVGEETELDRTIVEEISDPLIHMVRNSVDHGLEPADVRRQRGKSVIGQITLNAFHQGGSIVIQIQDDGAGLNREKILAKAVERGLASPNDALSDADVYSFIFAPGFSTAEKITDLSGRGVGMDVVKRNIEKLRGKIEITSTPGQGAIFSIYLPLTLAIIEGLVVKVANERYIIPALSVQESFRPSREMLSTVQQRGEMVNVRGRLLPLLRLYKLFDIEPRTTDPTQSISIVVESAHRQRCVMVDELIGKQEVVIKSLSEQFKRNPYLAGAAILGDGQVGLILNTSTLVDNV